MSTTWCTGWVVLLRPSRPHNEDPMRVAFLTAADADVYRSLMLDAYEQAPDAFTSTAAERGGETRDWWVKRIGSESGLTTAFGAWQGDRLVGTVALEYSAKPKTRHTALVLGMYVLPDQRVSGIGRSLMKSAIAAATSRPEVLVLNLTLTEGNQPARRLYQSLGFVTWGVQPNALRIGSRFKGKVHMSLTLTRPNDAG